MAGKRSKKQQRNRRSRNSKRQRGGADEEVKEVKEEEDKKEESFLDKVKDLNPFSGKTDEEKPTVETAEEKPTVETAEEKPTVETAEEKPVVEETPAASTGLNLFGSEEKKPETEPVTQKKKKNKRPKCICSKKKKIAYCKKYGKSKRNRKSKMPKMPKSGNVFGFPKNEDREHPSLISPFSSDNRMNQLNQ